MTASISSNTGFWAELSNELSSGLTLSNFLPISFTLAPAGAALCFKETFDKHCEANHISPWISKPISILTDLSAAALALIAIPEGLLRSVIAIAFSVFNILTGFENPMPGDGNFEKIVTPVIIPLIAAAQSLGLDID